jgi:hypothetical protein
MEELTQEELMSLPTEELKNLFLKTRSMIFAGKRKKIDTTNIEIYNCYILKALEEKAKI